MGGLSTDEPVNQLQQQNLWWGQVSGGSSCSEEPRDNTGWLSVNETNWGKRVMLWILFAFFVVVIVAVVLNWSPKRRQPAHKPCLARAAVTSWASVESCGDSRRLMLPAEDRRGEVPPVSIPGEWVTTISAPWSTRALADSRKVSLWLSICRDGRVQVVVSISTEFVYTHNIFVCFFFFFFTMMFPPPGIWLVLSREPTLAWAFSLKSSFTFSMRTWPPPRTGIKPSDTQSVPCSAVIQDHRL